MMSTNCIVTIRYEFHGTALSAPNHMSRENQGEQRAAIQVNISDKSVPELPNSYALTHPVELGNNPVFVPIEASSAKFDHLIVLCREPRWMTNCGWHMSTRCYSTTLFRGWSHHMVSVQLSAHEWRLAETTGSHRGFTSHSRQSSLSIHDKTCNAT